ncbi:MAG: aminotransferase class III-fold pyridoxal phosphate-dependent enzyme, partial [Bryobacteraceae bacterium]
LLQESLIANAADMGAYIMNRIRDWPQRFACVDDVRGLGLMIGIEIVRNQERAPDLRNRLVTLAFERGLLILGCGRSSIRLCPPLVIERDQADFAVDTLEQCLRALES